ncbi:MAG: P-type DNA transfer ATPase VirB11 [Candidatus Andeanibacterium colombiense]|uniref:Type IV secretion system protein n=1 Tax=Candidatus Andeanibacterium colombiense TaxID=3121345 RepID=A0AAJ5X2E1_9SPHN|nr:MAG: P-type DNA transfer ATPase VirB11 [Sphingomonadaceae bacterium]
MSEVLDGGVYLDSFLAPLSPYLAEPLVTDIYVNRPGEIWTETLGGAIERHACAALSEPVLMRLARQIAARSSQGISREHPLLAASLPDGARVQVVAPPATRGYLAMAIRKHVAAKLSLADYAAEGAFDGLEPAAHDLGTAPRFRSIGGGEALPFIADAVQQRRNVLISGGTSTGKTTFLGALLREIPADERLILIEDTPELDITHDNAVGLLAARSALSETSLSAEDLLIAALRMRPDRIILGELRGKEAYTFLRTVNTGHPGSMTTIHADSPMRAIEQLALLVLQSGAQLRWDDVLNYVRSSIDVFVQLERSGGRRRVSEVMVRE